MSCFWDGLSSSLYSHNLIKNQPPAIQLAKFLKIHNMYTPNVKWQGERLSPQQMKENVDHISNYDTNQVGSGYLCSTCDPFLLLVSQLFRVNIEHQYLNTKIHYVYECTCGKTPILRFRSDYGHFSSA